MPTPTHVYVVRDPDGLDPPTVRRYRLRKWGRAGPTVWDRGRVRFVQYRTRGQWICGDEENVRLVLEPIFAAKRAAALRLVAIIDRVSRDGIRIESVPEGG